MCGLWIKHEDLWRQISGMFLIRDEGLLKDFKRSALLSAAMTSYH